ncbi:hypothetical protein [Niallia sp. 03133]|uniref:hypothetical protein n=1 Tax=Niallia sp. 03133 TaxID=3458060 RepID=UPI00404465CE
MKVYIELGQPGDKFILQEEEVEGIYKTDLSFFYEFCLNGREEIMVEAIHLDQTLLGSKHPVNKDDFVPREESYFKNIALLIKQQFYFPGNDEENIGN